MRGERDKPSFSNSSAAIRFLAPGPVRPRHVGDQLLDVRRNPRAPPLPRRPAPEQPKGVAVPSNERVRLHNGERLAPLDESGERHEGQASGGGGATRLRLTFEVQRQLLAEEEILSGHTRVRP